MSSHSGGTLYIVATPIGNLSDISYRAVEILAQVDAILAEDTRHSRKLLQHLGITNAIEALHDHNEKQRAAALVGRLQQGSKLALISDAGTPLISDPGYALVNQCRQAGVRVVPVPGPCALIAALSAAGLPTDRFAFEGFVAVKMQQRRQQLQALRRASCTTIFYESPRRMGDTLKLLHELLGPERPVVVARELTKAYETFYSGSLAEVMTAMAADEGSHKGEFVLMIGPAAAVETDAMDEQAMATLALLQQYLPLKTAAALAAKIHGGRKNALYEAALRQQNLEES